MNPLALRLTNVRTFADLDLTFQPGVTAIVGANGAGKSTLIDALDLALFAGVTETGKAPQPGRELTRKLTRGEDVLEIELRFEHAGGTFRVRRQLRRGKSPTLDLETLDQGEDENPDPARFVTYREFNKWESLTRESTDATQARICELLGLSRATFRASAFVGQSDGGAFTEAPARDRKAVLAEILALDQWRVALDRVRVDRRAAEGEVAGLRAKAEVAQAIVDRRPEHEDRREGAAASVRHETHRLGLQEQVLAEARDALAAQAANEERVRATSDAHATATRERHILGSQAVAQQRERARLRTEERDVAVKVLELREKARQTALQTLRTCDRCGQGLAADARDRAAASYRAEADLLSGRIVTLDSLAGAAEERAEALHAQAAAVDTDVTARKLADVRAALGDIAALRAAASAAQDAVARHRAALDDARARVIRAEAEIERCQQAEQDLAATVERTAEVATRVETLVVLERAFGPNGIPAWLIERYAVPQIEAEANRILADFATPYRVELRTQREKKDGGLAEALDIVVSDGMHEGDYSEFSGGEKTRLNLALRIALAGLLANRRGAESRVLCIDEPDNLDAAGMERLVEILGGLSSFSCILVVSHHPLLASSFDQVIQIEKVGDRSRLVEAEVPAVTVA